MYRLMIIDDELMARAKIKAALADIPDIYVDQEAVNGEDALKQMQDRLPDIALVDMRMPVMGGTEFIRRARQFYPRLAILALSGYEDYEYVRESMKYGALDYILKSELTSETLRDGLRLCEAEIRRSLDREQESRQASRHRISAQELARRQAILQLLQGNLPDAEELAQVCGFDGQRQVFHVAVMQIDSIRRHEKDHGRIATILMNSIITSIAQEAINQHGTGLIEPLEDGEFVIILPFEKMLSYRYAGDICRQLINVLQQNLEKYTNLTASFSVDAGVVPLQEIAQSYRKARQSISLSYLKGKSTVISADTPVRIPEFMSLDEERARMLNSSLSAGDAPGCAAAVHAVFDQLIAGNASKSSCQIICIELLNILLRSVSACPLNSELHARLELCKQDILSYDSIDESRQALLDAAASAAAFLTESRRLQGYNHNTIRAIEYIQQHYSGDVSLDTVARQLNVNKSYLSRTFSTDCGESLTEYVTAFRLSRAQQLLQSGVSIAQTAAEVGIENLPYFFRLFKRHTGRTPQSYQPKESRE